MIVVLKDPSILSGQDVLNKYLCTGCAPFNTQRPKMDNFLVASENQTLEVAENDKFWMGYMHSDNNRKYIYDFTAQDASYNLEFGGTDVTMSDASPVPSPTSLLLLGAGLVGLMGYRLNSQSKKR